VEEAHAKDNSNQAQAEDFWAGKTPCWIVRSCPEEVRNQCHAYLDRSRACWEIPDSSCSSVLGMPKTCEMCKVLKSWQAG
jgi:hypothetical protein